MNPSISVSAFWARRALTVNTNIIAKYIMINLKSHVHYEPRMSFNFDGLIYPLLHRLPEPLIVSVILTPSAHSNFVSRWTQNFTIDTSAEHY
jgi:hypothetical protein